MSRPDQFRFAGWLASALLAGCLFLPLNARSEDGWHNTLTPYFLGASIEGRSSLLDRTVDVEVPVSDVLDTLDMGYMMRYRGENELFSINGEVAYMKLSDAQAIVLGPRGGVPINVDGENEMLVVQADAGWKIASAERGFAEVYLGLRYTDLTMRMRVDFPEPIGSRRTEGSDEFFDPLIGLRGNLPLGDRWALKMQYDIGGFGVGMDLTWGAFGALEYRFSERFGGWFGYQGLGQDFENAGEREIIDMDVTYHGPVIGVAFSW